MNDINNKFTGEEKNACWQRALSHGNDSGCEPTPALDGISPEEPAAKKAEAKKVTLDDLRIDLVVYSYKEAKDGTGIVAEKTSIPLIEGKALKCGEAVWLDNEFACPGKPGEVSYITINLVGPDFTKEVTCEYKIPKVNRWMYCGIQAVNKSGIILLLGDRYAYTKTEPVSLF